MNEFKESSRIVKNRIAKMKDLESHSDSLLLHSLLKTSANTISEKIITALLIESGAVQAIILEKGIVVFKFGTTFVNSREIYKVYKNKEFLSFSELKIISEFRIMGENFVLYGKETRFPKGKFLVFLLVPANRKLDDDSLNKLDHYLKNYYINEKVENVAITEFPFSDTEKSLGHEFSISDFANSSVAILKLQKLNNYISVTGSYRSLDFFREIKKHVESFLEDSKYKVYLISERVVIIIMPDLKKADARQNLEEMFISVDGLIVDYNLYVLQLNEVNTVENLRKEIYNIIK